MVLERILSIGSKNEYFIHVKDITLFIEEDIPLLDVFHKLQKQLLTKQRIILIA